MPWVSPDCGASGSAHVSGVSSPQPGIGAPETADMSAPQPMQGWPRPRPWPISCVSVDSDEFWLESNVMPFITVSASKMLLPPLPKQRSFCEIVTPRALSSSLLSRPWLNQSFWSTIQKMELKPSACCPKKCGATRPSSLNCNDDTFIHDCRAVAISLFQRCDVTPWEPDGSVVLSYEYSTTAGCQRAAVDELH